MNGDVAWQRYRERHMEPDLPPCSGQGRNYRHVVVIPAYAESPQLLSSLARLTPAVLVILVLNCPETATATRPNDAMRDALESHGLLEQLGPHCALRALPAGSALLVYDLERARGPSPADQGVGLARKVGCDIACLWFAAGCIESSWILNTDADAILPASCFERLRQLPGNAAAAVLPFYHTPCETPLTTRVTALYELRLHYYVLGLEFARSPYAYHSLGSCLAVSARHYVRVRGFPKRAAGEDFHLLNKLRKTGPIIRLAGSCITLESRLSARVPFGTGPAATRLALATAPDDTPLFYHPDCFRALRAVLETVAKAPLDDSLPGPVSPQEQWAGILQRWGLDNKLAEASAEALADLGLHGALQHCRRQSNDDPGFRRHFEQWFDALRSLRFIHLLRSAGWAELTLAESLQSTPLLWPAAGTDHQLLRDAIHKHWGWTLPSASPDD
ncbi:hypothetical protein CWI75_14490 [Kineobactrum sediminis]|uniref:Glycosyltransferase 2-like domain-containing protein n=1 Tax=Kineobactrum sediminis TaxID=1905677 RepID=A0A2N5XZU4_9GAMM|nr:hypothetical protein [Kineobactrum sediminis]PLW81670.1 hypothetical protein CWI75_14490 [Kineobactrum sediminis]